ncbi:MAG: helix-turn-helix transcriptional regulator [Clostridia bacterium]|nr:helix-turn-helix transcriptional regulator [Clostridia bacterium]
MFYQFQHYGTTKAFCKENGKNFSFPIHLHHFFELIVVTCGEMEVVIDGEIYLLKSGEGVLVFPHQVHSLSSIDSEHSLCIFSPELIKAYTSKYIDKIPADSSFVLKSYLLERLKQIDEESSLFDKKGFLYSVCAEFEQNRKYKERMKEQESLLYSCFEFVERNYKNNCTLYELCQETNFSYSYISRYFKKMTGISFNEYLNQYRIMKACRQFEELNCSVLSCAYDVGYNSLRSFNRNFKKYAGVTPRQYMK